MIEPTGNRVIVTDLEHGERQLGEAGIVITDDNGKRKGIRPRWCKVHIVGPEVTDIEPGEWILVKHGRWTYKFKETDQDGIEQEFWIVDYPKYVLCASKEKPDFSEGYLGSE